MPLPEHRLATFQGLLVSMSGLSAREKQRLGDVIAQGGGRTSGELNKHCTHLVCKTATGDKWKCAPGCLSPTHHPSVISGAMMPAGLLPAAA